MQAANILPHSPQMGQSPPNTVLSNFNAAAIVNRWRVDPIDQWRREADGRRFIRPGDAVPSGDEAAGRVAQLLRDRGHRVEVTSHKAPFDLLVDGRLRVEVKFSRWHQHDGRGRYQATFRTRQAEAADLVVFVARNGTDHHFIIPTNDLARSITIRQYDIDRYAGKYAGYLDAWQAVDDALGRTSHRCYQLVLPEVTR